MLAVAPNFSEATHIIQNGWMAVLFAILSMIIYFSGLICSHISAFRVATNIRIKAMKHITDLPFGIIDERGS